MNRIATYNRLPALRLFFTAAIFFAAAIVLYAGEGIGTLRADDFFQTYEADKASGDAVVIDVRTPSEFSQGHAPGALNIDYYANDFADQLNQLDKSKNYFIYCRSGSRSGKSLATFRSLGFESVYDLAGGWSYNARRLSALEE